jgi:hypothetical protein
MKPGYKRLTKYMDESRFDADEFIEDTRAIAAQSSEMADIFLRMIEAELNVIKQQKDRNRK